MPCAGTAVDHAADHLGVDHRAAVVRDDVAPQVDLAGGRVDRRPGRRAPRRSSTGRAGPSRRKPRVCPTAACARRAPPRGPVAARRHQVLLAVGDGDQVVPADGRRGVVTATTNCPRYVDLRRPASPRDVRADRAQLGLELGRQRRGSRGPSTIVMRLPTGLCDGKPDERVGPEHRDVGGLDAELLAQRASRPCVSCAWPGRRDRDDDGDRARRRRRGPGRPRGTWSCRSSGS